MGMVIHTCERCRECFTGNPYRVQSEDEDGIRLLDMLVCYVCYREAWQLGLETQKVDAGQIALH